ncbi:A/G-specific adenine glycosylase [Croceivirga thetidis]|uniref:Adenine DNA glycosylase n=1 Tax=Croceivirga thetidis TaxID=2721623 RepID=A0ABX1GNM7_9FLAO|nr:A/G-specific adenine glycosylase [Croceivirga thetidis]NKI31520.1 A/G-specific adenine glycosylase [Croceivirga thetidis]
MSFSDKILRWYAENKRKLPWRSTIDPYKIWLSEVMLQQTRVAQGLPYYEKFVEAYPTVFDLAKASEEEVLKLWQGLGYYSRARNMHQTAKKVAEEFNGNFPNTYAEIVKLKGIGDYTASAIASICFDEQVPVVDGNVYRVLARYFGVDVPINSNQGIKLFKELAHKVMAKENIRDYNQGIMEFGAIQCSPKKPACLVCPLNESCKALEIGMVNKLPVKLKKTKIKVRHFNYLVVLDDFENTILEQRIGKGIWQNLYQFPLVESDNELTQKMLLKSLPDFLHGVKEISLFNEKPIVHKLSHQHLNTKFWIVNIQEIGPDGISISDLKKYPVPVLISDFIESFNF